MWDKGLRAAKPPKPMTTSPETRYVAASDLAVVEYDTESVVFNGTTWETHVLNPAAAAVLALISEAPQTIDGVAQALTLWLEADEAADAPAHAARSVAELAGLALIVPMDDAAR